MRPQDPQSLRPKTVGEQVDCYAFSIDSTCNGYKIAVILTCKEARARGRGWISGDLSGFFGDSRGFQEEKIFLEIISHGQRMSM